jgi:hypothetical protein
MVFREKTLIFQEAGVEAVATNPTLSGAAGERPKRKSRS